VEPSPHWGGRLSLFTCFWELAMVIFGLLSLKLRDGGFIEEPSFKRFKEKFANAQKPVILKFVK
jgi:hypothetical protein